MKILHVISQRPDSTGSGIFLQQIIARADRAGHENFLICGLGKDDMVEMKGIDPSHVRPVRFETDDNPGQIVGMSDVMPYPSRTFRSLDSDALKKYQHVIRGSLISAANRIAPDLVHSHHLWLATSLIGETLPDIPSVVSCHGSELRQFAQCPHLQQLVQSGCSKIDRICALSSLQKNEISTGYHIAPEKITVSGGGFDESIFNIHTKQQQKSNSPLQILYAGKLSRAKGVIWLLRALTRLHESPFHLHIAGNGHGIEYEQCLHAAAQLKNRVTFHGSITQQQLAHLMRQSQLLVLPSMFEGLPLVILEALACGCRVIATDLPGVKEIAYHIDTDHLALVPAPDVIDINSTILDDEDRFVSDLTDSLRRNLIDISHPNIHTSIQPELDYFTWQSVFERIQAVWKQAMKIRRI